MGLWDGARRLPYFYTYAWLDDGKENWVLCPQCALVHREDKNLTPRYTTLRSVMCSRCSVVMGPINQAEMEKAE